MAGWSELRFDEDGPGNHRVRTRIVRNIRREGEETQIKELTAQVELPVRCLRPHSAATLPIECIYASRWKWWHSTDN